MTMLRGSGAGHGGQEDASLFVQITQRDAGALEAIYGRYGRACYSLARRILGDEFLARDVVQEVFLALWRGVARYDPARGAFSTWLLSLTHHKAVDLVRREENLRKRRTSVDVLEGQVFDGPQVDEQVWSTLRQERVRAALGTLPPPQREALALAYFGGYTQREIAGLTGAPLGTVKTRMLAGMRRLRDELAGLRDVPPGLGS